jgi:hypothetical protein
MGEDGAAVVLRFTAEYFLLSRSGGYLSAERAEPTVAFDIP